ncbi:MAG: hypothetical protein N838_07215 [Thiohalocapsa sp. PB-PSB1]|jgi:16S rRNA (cytosine967-C5)-methyltransferase|nr:MAG: hypothetical protein N838_07215 [Thiohalocapsa sp. PB-PSB1]
MTWTVSCLADAKRPPKISPAGVQVRAAAARSVHAVRAEGRSLTDLIAQNAAEFDQRDAALYQALCFGTLRLLPRLDALTALLLSRSLQPGDLILKDLIAVGLYQLTSMRIPEHAVVASTVAASRTLGKARATGLVNATLRRFQRERPALLACIADDPDARWLFPHWLLTRLQAAWPDSWQTIVDACNKQAPMALRVNRLRTSRREYAALLAAQGLSARPLPVAKPEPGRLDERGTMPTFMLAPELELEHALILDQALPTHALPGYMDGLVSVQDASAQWAAALLDARVGDQVLDACAAPGGKTAHLLERGAAGINVTAIDIDPERLKTLQQNLDRLGLSARVQVADASRANADWRGAPYQRILLDAPCSATGVIRRHPDIKWLRRDADIAVLVSTQRAMLDALWPLLATGGRLVYATCSLLPEENDVQVRGFLQRHADASERPIVAARGLARNPGWQLLPESGSGDGFYYAVLEKSS